jgi:hypothetical protein
MQFKSMCAATHDVLLHGKNKPVNKLIILFSEQNRLTCYYNKLR